MTQNAPPRPHPKNPELLAPAGDFTCLTAAANAGADAVYFGVGDLNMRAGGARNFTPHDIPKIATFANARGIRTHLAVNTLVFDREREAVQTLLDAARDNVDAVIGWDPFVLRECVKRHIPFHVSTQASVANTEAARFYRDLGASRIILARECTLDEAATIQHQAGVEIEVFIHGAMCMSVSGRCFLSQDVFGHSGNRGRCLQNCRRTYRIVDVEEDHEYILGEQSVMSAKDLCTLPFLDTILATGVDSLKIEGRGRNPDYVQVVVSAYRRAIDAWQESQLDDSLKTHLVDELSTVFNRGFSRGFYMGRPIAKFTERGDSQATLRKEYVGVVKNYFAHPGVAEIEVLAHEVNVDCQLMIQGPTTGVVHCNPKQIRQDEREVQTAFRGRITVKLPQKVRRGDQAYVLTPR